MIVKRVILLTIVLLIIIDSHAQKIFYAVDSVIDFSSINDTSNLIHNVFLLGDIQDPQQDNNNLMLLKKHINRYGENSTVVILGDILYPYGLRDSSDVKYIKDKQNLDEILNIFKNYNGKVIFLPGNHDWDIGRKDGLENVLNEEAYIEKYFNMENVYLPDNGCPGPVEVELTEDITLIVFDSQWYFHKNDKPLSEDECGIVEVEDLFIQLEDAIRRNRDKKVIIATHHPLISAGEHGGHFPPSYLLFPLLEAANWLYIPLPGFLYTGYRKYFGDTQDLANPEYKIFTNRLLEITSRYPDLIYAAGHDHNLQYINYNGLNHIISGGNGEKRSYFAKKKKKADFAYQHKGFNKLSFYSNGNVYTEFICPDESDMGNVIFKKKLYNKKIHNPGLQISEYQALSFKDSTITIKLTDIYNKSDLYLYLMGDNYRNLWSTDVNLEVFDMGSVNGGLSIIKRGGGQQTKSIRMKDANGKQWVLRSVNKNVEKALDKKMINTIAVDVLQDGISASHPFSSLAVPKLADAAGIFHTNPRIVWVPDDPRLGIFREEMANGVFLFEERPAGKRKDIASFGRSKKIINTADVIKITQKKHESQIDQQSVVRARIFDILINDWDRHDDQWRWASFKEGKTTIYKPIPRDRDQVFFVNEGVAMWLATQTYPLRKFQGFDEDIDDIKGLTYNARYFDRSFATEPNLEDWIRITKQIQENITDSIIHEAILSFPPSIYDSSGAEIEQKLKGRRDNLEFYIEKYYSHLSKNVDIVGTKERELFDVERKANGNTLVTVYALSDKKGKVREQLYKREFNSNITKEIRLYGLAGKDKFKVVGSATTGLKVRIIGGKDNDLIIDSSYVKGVSRKTIVYDRKDKKNKIRGGSETKIRLSKHKSVNKYHRKQFKHNRYMPFLYGGYNIDDGVSIGAGMSIKKYNFRDSTFHTLKGLVAFRTGAYSIVYNGLFSSFSNYFDLLVDAQISLPRNVDNYFGIGNETLNNNDKKYYRVRYEYAWVNPMLQHKISEKINYSFGIFYQYFKVTDTSGRYIGQCYPTMLDSTAFTGGNYTGINSNVTIDTRNNEVLPQRGILWETNATGYYNLVNEGNNFAKLTSDLRLYFSFRKDPRFVFALRFGGAVNYGDYEFYHANFIGGSTNMRGFRSNRFAGDNSFYQNTEIRLKLSNIRSYILNGQFGIFGFNDVARVWVSGENSKQWHHGYGGGIWLTPYDFTAITCTYNQSKEEKTVSVSFRFLF